jgi:hypothetical protein
MLGMTCIKTGCHIYIEQYGEFARGDAHAYNGMFVFRLVEISHEPLAPTMHFQIRDVVEWFDRFAMERHGTSSTLLAFDVENFGYDGIKVSLEETVVEVPR